MLRAGSFLFMLITSLIVARFCSVQDARTPMPATISQSSLRMSAPRPDPVGSGLGDMPGISVGDDVLKQQAIAANLQRQIEIRRDTEKMFQLTEELKNDLQKADHVLSLEAIKKAEQIEKLAHSVKSKMKQSF